MQFYLGTWWQMRGGYPLHMEGQQNHKVAYGRRTLVNGGQTE